MAATWLPLIVPRLHGSATQAPETVEIDHPLGSVAETFTPVAGVDPKFVTVMTYGCVDDGVAVAGPVMETPTSPPAPTEKELDVPLSAPALLVAVMVKLPLLLIVTLRDARTPLVNAGEVPPPSDNVPVEVTLTVPLNDGTVLLFASCAV